MGFEEVPRNIILKKSLWRLAYAFWKSSQYCEPPKFDNFIDSYHWASLPTHCLLSGPLSRQCAIRSRAIPPLARSPEKPLPRRAPVLLASRKRCDFENAETRSLKITSTSAEGQKFHENLAPVLVIISGNSLVFSGKIITSTGFYRYLRPRRVSTSSGNKWVSQKRCDLKSRPPENRSDFLFLKVWAPSLCLFAVSQAKRHSNLKFAISKDNDCDFTPRFFCDFFCGTCGESCDFELRFENVAIAIAIFWDAKPVLW